MSKTRKLLSVVVALMMVVSMFAMTANAAYYYEDEAEAAKNTQTWALSEPVENSDGTYSVDVLLTTNYATGPIQFVLTNTNPEVAAIKSVTIGDAIPDSYNVTDPSVSKAKGKVMIIADTAGVATITAEEINGVIATVVYTYSGLGSATIAIDDNAKSATNVGGTLIAARMSNGNLVTGDPITGQTVTVGNSVIIGGSAAQAPTLAVIDGTNGVIDTTRTELDYEGNTVTGYIYGIQVEDDYETFEDVFEVVGDGDWEVIPNAMDCELGTGTIFNVVDLDGNVVESYVFIYFGDLNGDGEITYDDTNIADLHAGWYERFDEDPIALFAGDLDGDMDITYDDVNIADLHAGWYERIVQADVISNL